MLSKNFSLIRCRAIGRVTIMEKLFQSVALIQKFEAEKSRFLLKRQPAQHYWKFIVADRLNKESFRESTIREVAWQLDLQRKTDFLVSNMAQLSIEFIESLSENTHRHVAVAFYNVHLYRRTVLESLLQDRSVRWVTAAELCRGVTADGQAIDTRVVKWINDWDVVQPWL
jgi:hypothetical protein